MFNTFHQTNKTEECPEKSQVLSVQACTSDSLLITHSPRIKVENKNLLIKFISHRSSHKLFTVCFFIAPLSWSLSAGLNVKPGVNS